MTCPSLPIYFKTLWILICLLTLSQVRASDQLELELDWTLINIKNATEYPGTLPGNVYSDLHRAGRIPDPLAANNAEKVQWVAHSDWIYRSANFSFSQDVLERKHIELELEAVDTYAEVYLNGELILECNNAFRIWKVEIGHLLDTYVNVLEIHLSSAYAKGEEQLNDQAHPLPGEPIRAVTRKPQFQYGWDWAPELNTMGVHRPLRIVAWDDVVIRDLRCETLSITDEKAELVARVLFDLDHKTEFSYTAVMLDGRTTVKSYSDTIQRGDGTFSIEWEFEVDNPKLWWTHDLGDPFLYELIWKFQTQNDQDGTSVPVGIRTIDLITEPDPKGSTFHFELNGHPTYMRGANWVPMHVFDSEAENPADLLNACKDVNMNMLRVWGGGWYERDSFYDQCDSLGLLVWQDFMFACAMYPGDKAFLENVQEEATDQLERLGKHPCIALWCGNNENSEGWERWGWKSGLEKKEIKAVQKSYDKLFKKLLPKLIQEWDDADYWESSPMLGRGDTNYVNTGDAHNWWVWHDAAPFENYQEQVPRFMSEFGFQSFPNLTTWEGALREEQLDTNAVSLRAHQKHVRGFALISEYLERSYPEPSNFEELTYLSQLNQSRGICMGIDAQRSSERYCMGSLYWQLNDCWPAVSWSSIGSDGSWKALHYDLRSAYHPIHLHAIATEAGFEVKVTNDRLEASIGQLKMEIFTMEGRSLGIQEIDNVILASNRTFNQVFSFDTWEGEFDLKKCFAVLSWNSPEVSHERILTFPKPKELELLPQEIKQSVSWQEDHFEIELSASHYHKDIWLRSGIPGIWSENFVDLPPNEPRIIQFYPEEADAFLQLEILSLNAFQ